MALLHNAYGHFSDDGTEYRITRPDTPMPWINVISNGDYGITLSQAGSGYSWRTHAGLNRITRWQQDLIRDDWGKYLYIRDSDSGHYWSPTHQPCGTNLDNYLVSHGMGYSSIAATHSTIASHITYTVPLDAPCELWILRLTNHGTEQRHLQIYTYFEWNLGATPDWHREFQRLFIETNYDPDQCILLATKLLWELPGESGPHWNRTWPYVAFHSASSTPSGFEGDKRAFLGRHGNLSAPQALQRGYLHNTAGRWGDAIGSLQVPIDLAPGATTDIVFVLGATNNHLEAQTLADRFRDPAAAHAALTQVQHFWAELTSALHIETPDPAFNIMSNTWLAYQTISGRLWGRTAYYQTGGAYGFRDQLQDSMIWLLLGQPARTLEHIRLHAAHQYQEGTVLHWWHPLAESGLRSNYSDDLLWLPYVTLAYLHETGNIACLEEPIAFFDGGAGTLREHCVRAFNVALTRRSPRGLPLILNADWNDGLNAVGASGRGESIWMAHFLTYLLRNWAEIPALDANTQTHFLTEAAAITTAINLHGWDGEWYWRATTDAGTLIGSHTNAEGQIFLNAQTWAILAGTAPTERAEQAMASARERLFTPYGALLLAPAYTHPNKSIGYLSRYAPGTRENGGVYAHAACWAILAERRISGSDAAYHLWRSFCPAIQSAEPDTYMAEPYVMAGNIDGPLAALPGRGGWSWYTGSAAWCLRAMLEGILGIEARWEGLTIQPDLPAAWASFRITRRFRNATYNINIRRSTTSEETGCLVNGARWSKKTLPIASPGTTHHVEIII